MSQTERIPAGHPKGLYLLFTVEMWERFSYYGMRAILVLFMVKFLVFTTEQAGDLYGWYTSLVYLTPLLGGYLADRYLGQRRSIVIGALVMALGEFALMGAGLSMTPKEQVVPIVLTKDQAAAFAANPDAALELASPQKDAVGSVWKNFKSATARVAKENVDGKGCVALTVRGDGLVSTAMPAIPGRTLTLFGLGLALLILGNGFFKPNISTTVGQLYGQNDPRRDGAFTIFYMGINLGAFFSPLVCGTLGEKYGWHWGFAAAGTGMLAGLTVYFWGQHKYLGEAGLHPAGAPKKTGAAAHEPLTKAEWQRIAVVFVLVFFNIFFWSAFELAGSALTLFADRSTDRVLPIVNWEFPASWYQSVNPALIFILAPLFSGLWLKLARARREPSTPNKMALGLAMLTAGMLVMVFAANLVGKSGGKVSALWLTGCYFMCTLGELCLSPVGLSAVTKLAPARFGSLMMGTWFLSNAAANYLQGAFAGQYDNLPLTTFYLVPVGAASVSAIVLLALAPKLRQWMHGIH